MTITSLAHRCLHSFSSVHRTCSPLHWATKHSSFRQLTTAQAAVVDPRCTLCVSNASLLAQRQQLRSGLLRTSRGLQVQATEAEVTGQSCLLRSHSSAVGMQHLHQFWANLVCTEAVAVAGDWLEAQKLDIRVGRVLSAELHPDADR